MTWPPPDTAMEVTALGTTVALGMGLLVLLDVTVIAEGLDHAVGFGVALALVVAAAAVKVMVTDVELAW